MGKTERLVATDGHTLDAWVARPEGEVLGAIVVVQEVFGVNEHIKAVADGFARDGFLAVAPALFDRIERGIELGYEGADRDRAIGLMKQLTQENALLDVAAAVVHARAVTPLVGVVGYCYGGTMAWLAASRLKVEAAVGYYGGGIGKVVDEVLHAPVLLHFGELDTHIPPEQIDRIRETHPEVEIHLYPAQHGFNCDLRSSYEPESARKAREITLEFLKRHLVA